MFVRMVRISDFVDGTRRWNSVLRVDRLCYATDACCWLLIFAVLADALSLLWEIENVNRLAISILHVTLSLTPVPL